VGPWRSWERVPVKPGRLLVQIYFGGAVAQLGARLDGIEEVVGSNPIGSTKFIPVYYLYILQSKTTRRFYIGQTQDVSERLAYHNADYSKSLRNRGPWQLVHTEQFQTRSEAVLRERQVKSWKDHRMIERLVSASR
jgi:putative endonuclease